MSAVWIARLLAGLDLAADGVYFRPTATPSEGPGWKFLMARFDAAHRRREQMTLADIRRLDRERALEALRRELAADTERPAPT